MILWRHTESRGRSVDCVASESARPPIQAQSRLAVDSQGTRAGYTRVRTQVDGDSDVPRMRSVRRFSILSTDSKERDEHHDRQQQREPSTECSNTVSVGFDTHSDSEGGSLFVSEEEEEVEVPVVAGLPPVRPSVAA